MPHSLSSQIASAGAISTVIARARLLAVAAGYYFYGYWFSQRLA